MESIRGFSTRGSIGFFQKIRLAEVSWDRDGKPFFSMGEGTLQVPMAMHAAHRKKLCEAQFWHIFLAAEDARRIKNPP